MQLVVFAQFVQHFFAQNRAVFVGNGLGHVEDGAVDVFVSAGFDATDGIGIVLRLREEFGRSTTGAFGAQGVNAGAARAGAGECVGVDGDEKVGVQFARFGHAYAQRDENVFVACHIDFVAHAFHAFFGFARNGKDDVLLAQAALADGAGVFAAVAGVEHDNRLAVMLAVGWRRGRGIVRRFGRFRRLRYFGGRLYRRCAAACALVADFAFRVVFQQCHQRVIGILGVHRVEVGHQAVFEVGHGREGEKLRIDVGFQVDDDAYGVGGVLTDADDADIGVAALDFAVDALQNFIKLYAFEVEYEAARVVEGEVVVLQLFRRFQRDAAVGVGRPDTDGDKLRGGFGESGRCNGKQQACGGAADYLAAGKFFIHASKLLWPFSVCADRAALRPLAQCVRVSVRSAGGVKFPPFCGHSIRQTVLPPVKSSSPASSHSSGAEKR